MHLTSNAALWTTLALALVNCGVAAANFAAKDKELARNIEMLVGEIQQKMGAREHGMQKLSQIAESITLHQLQVTWLCVINITLGVLLVSLLYKSGKQ